MTYLGNCDRHFIKKIVLKPQGSRSSICKVLAVSWVKAGGDSQKFREFWWRALVLFKIVCLSRASRISLGCLSKENLNRGSKKEGQRDRGMNKLKANSWSWDVKQNECHHHKGCCQLSKILR